MAIKQLNEVAGQLTSGFLISPAFVRMSVCACAHVCVCICAHVYAPEGIKINDMIVIGGGHRNKMRCQL